MVLEIYPEAQGVPPFTIEGLEKGGLTYYAKISMRRAKAVLGGTIDRRFEKKMAVARVIDLQNQATNLNSHPLVPV